MAQPGWKPTGKNSLEGKSEEGKEDATDGLWMDSGSARRGLSE